MRKLLFALFVLPFIAFGQECPNPTISGIANISETSADVSWGAVVGAQGYAIIYGPEGFADGFDFSDVAGAVALDGAQYDYVSAASLMYTFPNTLDANTTYDVYLVTICDFDIMDVFASDFSDPDFAQLTTLGGAECTTPEGVLVDGITANSADVMWEPGDENQTQWEILYGPTGFDVNTEGTSVIVTDPVYTIEGLDAETEYDVYVRALCDDNEESDWTAIETFETDEEDPCLGSTLSVTITSANPGFATCQGTPIVLAANYDPQEGITRKWSNNQIGPTISVGVAGQYHVTITDDLGCKASDTVTVVVNPLPVLSLPTTAAFCEGTDVTLTASNNTSYSYLWNTEEITNSIVVSTADTFSVVATSAEGCSKTASVIVSEDLNPVIDSLVYMINSDYSISFELLISENVTGYQWNFGDGTSINNVAGPTHFYENSGSYTVTVTATNQCSSSTQTVVVNASGLGIEENALGNLSVYPVPANNMITFDYQGTQYIEVITIANTMGQVVYTGATSQIDVSNFSNGLYFTNIILSDGNVIQSKFEVLK